MVKDGKFGLIDVSGREVVPTEYTGPEILEMLEEYKSGAAAAPAALLAHASTQTVLLDGKEVEFQCYALWDEQGYPTNYIKLRDLALLVSGTAAQFEVSWDGRVLVNTGKAYTPNGSELSTPFSGDRDCTVPAEATLVNGSPLSLAAIFLTDDAGGGYTYYKLRDLGEALGFNVGWDPEAGRIFVETDKPYDPSN